LDDPSRPIWKARRNDDESIIVVKFTCNYNVKAHIICVEKGYAPKLLHFSDDNETKKLGGI
jgi:hypothetical protein